MSAAVPSVMYVPTSVTPVAPVFTTAIASPRVAGVWPPPPLPPAPMSAVNLTPRTARFSTDTVQIVGPSDGYSNSNVYPPPPLPPISAEVTARIEALELQRAADHQLLREMDVERDAAEAGWKATVELLEAKLRNGEAASSRKVAAVEQEVERKVRAELRSQAAELRSQVEARSAEAEENFRLRAEIAHSQASIRELQLALEAETSQVSNMHRGSTVDDLRRQLEAITRERDMLADDNAAIRRERDMLADDYATIKSERDMLSEDNAHLKKALSHREEEVAKLRDQHRFEGDRYNILVTERDRLSAELDAARSRARYEDDAERLSRLSVASPRMYSLIESASDQQGRSPRGSITEAAVDPISSGFGVQKQSRRRSTTMSEVWDSKRPTIRGSFVEADTGMKEMKSISSTDAEQLAAIRQERTSMRSNTDFRGSFRESFRSTITEADVHEIKTIRQERESMRSNIDFSNQQRQSFRGSLTNADEELKAIRQERESLRSSISELQRLSGSGSMMRNRDGMIEVELEESSDDED